MQVRAEISITGVVQGVGFRPFVYAIAKGLSLAGYVLNRGDAGVLIVAEGERSRIEELIRCVSTDPPSIAHIESLDVVWRDSIQGLTDFTIKPSTIERRTNATPEIPPDIAVCKDCVRELLDPSSRWHEYPFTSCAACGPRYSTIMSLPYDRPNTTMVDFPLCSTCNTGYTNPTDRRYHAQTTACGVCGPSYRLHDHRGEPVVTANLFEHVGRLIDNGQVLAVQGIGGTHLVTKTTEPEAILELRKRKKRSQRPFAIMVRDLTILKTFANPTSEEEEILVSWRRPVVLVRKREKGESDDYETMLRVSTVIPHESLEAISPGLDTIGVMLPYSPLQYMLFRYSREPALVMTSANHSGTPMHIQPETIISSLQGVSDYFLLHNRRISQRVDDSVIKMVGSKPLFIRRGRGYAPESLRLMASWKETDVIAVGAEEKITGSILKSNVLYQTQHIGDGDRVETLDFLSEALTHVKRLVGVERVSGIACDLHPEFLTTEYAERLASLEGVPLFRVQHHHAHLAALVLDHGFPADTRITCITVDGYGYGADGNAWGGEILTGGLSRFHRDGGLMEWEIPSGDLSARYPARTLLALMSRNLDNSIIGSLRGCRIAEKLTVTEETCSIIAESIKHHINVVTTTSAGRFLDAVALILGICSENSYDGECPMKLEAAARPTDIRIEREYHSTDGRTQLDTVAALTTIHDLMKRGVPRAQLAYAAQFFLGDGLAELACDIAEESGTIHIGLSGGVALNRIVTDAVVARVRSRGLQPLVHTRVAPGDPGVSVGQAAVAAMKLAV
ncbi:MAG: carbamoyltransferase HypF [Candidatus Thorarchaeota archaeon]|nr:carbamoyltransferase HypF [Candidatus Thorarchaeota archaeon]